MKLMSYALVLGLAFVPALSEASLIDDPVAGEIITEGLDSPNDPLTVEWDPEEYEDIGEWAADWAAAVRPAAISGDTLRTCWVSAGTVVCEETTRESGESDQDFRNRHIRHTLAQMIDDPPDTGE